MKWIFEGFLGLHALIHLFGASKGLGISTVPQLSQQITPVLGVLWLSAAVLLLTAAICIIAKAQQWWVVGAAGVIISQSVIITSWVDAAYGTVANVIVLAGVIYAFITQTKGHSTPKPHTVSVTGRPHAITPARKD
ncbi:hypothetical protein [Paenarthrobacter sp. NPDC091669]|uniref:hypothetical protein n=1 Tax=Paenarthrobacter sp. NPDC091669 TaxID=3364384 RepID=UPI00380873B7